MADLGEEERTIEVLPVHEPQRRSEPTPEPATPQPSTPERAPAVPEREPVPA